MFIQEIIMIIIEKLNMAKNYLNSVNMNIRFPRLLQKKGFNKKYSPLLSISCSLRYSYKRELMYKILYERNQ
jgi:hypothetical protein